MYCDLTEKCLDQLDYGLQCLQELAITYYIPTLTSHGMKFIEILIYTWRFIQ